MGLLSFLLIEGVIIALYVTIVILVTISLAQVNDKKESESVEDRVHYDKARVYLGWAVGIGWALIVLGIIAIVIAIIAAVFFSPEEAVSGLTGLAAETVTSRMIIKTATNAKKGLLGFNQVFGMKGFFGFIEKAILFLSLLGIFIFGILAALAATEIGKTSDKRGYSQAIWAAILGIIPLVIFIIWWIADIVYTKSQKKKLEQLSSRQSVSKDSGGPISHSRSYSKTEVSHTKPDHRKSSTQNTHRQSHQDTRSKPPPRRSTTSNYDTAREAYRKASDVYDGLSDEQKQQMKDAAYKALDYAVSKYSS